MTISSSNYQHLATEIFKERNDALSEILAMTPSSSPSSSHIPLTPVPFAPNICVRTSPYVELVVIVSHHHYYLFFCAWDPLSVWRHIYDYGCFMICDVVRVSVIRPHL